MHRDRTAASVTTKFKTALPQAHVQEAAVHGRYKPQKWTVDLQGNIVDFDMGLLRTEILNRLQTGHTLYTLEECRVFIKEIAKVAAQWQEKELASLLYLTELHTKLLPGRQVVYQWPAAPCPPVPFSDPHDQLMANPLYKITKVVEELNRSIVRTIDQLWNDRRERLLLAARILRDLEPIMRGE